MRASSLLLLATMTGIGVASAAVGCGSDASPAPLPIGQPDIDGGVPIDEPPGTALGPQPDLGGTPQSQSVAPPPISGGTLIVLADDKTAVASDPDRDRVYIVDLMTATKLHEIALNNGDEPGRVIEDSHGKVHVALRRGGAIVDIDVATGNLEGRRDVCAAPRGIAFDSTADALHVACAGGELVTLPATSGAPTRTLRLENDLRDVLVRGDQLVVTKFRSAEILRLDAKGVVTTRLTPPIAFEKLVRSSAVAWRAAARGTMMAVVHQTGQDEPVGTSSGGYAGGGKCGGGIVDGQVTVIDDAEGATPVPLTAGIAMATLPVDIAISAGKKVAVVSPGNAHNSTLPQLFVRDGSGIKSDPCGDGWSWLTAAGELTAVAFAGEDVVAQSRQPAQLHVLRSGLSQIITLSDIDRDDTGHRIFHANSGSFIACASCHPEGGDDGRTWNFGGIGLRRTQTFRGGFLGTEPFHWDGDQNDLRMLMTTVFQKRMSGPVLTDDQLSVLSKWVDRVPNLPLSKPTDGAAVARGDALFHDTEVGCSGCHGGSKLTNNKTVDVGTGGMFQVPSLRGVVHRAPYMHTGCAKTLEDRFGPCGGGDNHGKTSHLTAAQIGDLVAYLKTL